MSMEAGVWGMKSPQKQKIEITANALYLDGKVCKIGDVVSVPEDDALYLIANGRAKRYPPPSEEKVSPAKLAKRRKEALNSGRYKVEITKNCFVSGYRCEPGEIVFLNKDGASNFIHSPYGKIIAVPPEEEDIETKVSRMIEEKFRGVSGERIVVEGGQASASRSCGGLVPPNKDG
jgi:hypothetical protein